MAITFHCEHCGKKIEAADTAGGKWGKCPACHNKLYVPSPDTGEELKLAPVDESDLERARRLMAETYKLTQDILQERDVPEGPAEPAGAMYELSEQELRRHVIAYLRQMAEGELDEAERTAALIAPSGDKTIRIIDRIALSEIPEPELTDIPQQMLAGAIRALRNRIG
jgi:phage FluMu protein Com